MRSWETACALLLRDCRSALVVVLYRLAIASLSQRTMYASRPIVRILDYRNARGTLRYTSRPAQATANGQRQRKPDETNHYPSHRIPPFSRNCRHNSLHGVVSEGPDIVRVGKGTIRGCGQILSPLTAIGVNPISNNNHSAYNVNVWGTARFYLHRFSCHRFYTGGVFPLPGDTSL
jgi:hypothetical protein